MMGSATSVFVGAVLEATCALRFRGLPRAPWGEAAFFGGVVSVGRAATPVTRPPATWILRSMTHPPPRPRPYRSPNDYPSVPRAIPPAWRVLDSPGSSSSRPRNRTSRPRPHTTGRMHLPGSEPRGDRLQADPARHKNQEIAYGLPVSVAS